MTGAEVTFALLYLSLTSILARRLELLCILWLTPVPTYTNIDNKLLFRSSSQSEQFN